MRAWKPGGDAKHSAAVEKRDASVSPSNCRRSTQAPNDGFGFPRALRLTRSRDILTVIREGKRIRTMYLDVRMLASPLAHSRIGMIVPKHQHNAVKRNRVKRRLRELARTEIVPALHGHPAHDVAIRARSESYDADFDTLRADVRSLVSRLRAELPDGA